MKMSNALLINQVAQGIKSQDAAMTWFRLQSDTDRDHIIRDLQHLVLQAKPCEGDRMLAVQRSRLKPTYTPCVLLRNGVLKEQVAKIVNLPKAEYEKCFKLLLVLLGIADRRRREEACKGNCSHWWHKDLSDKTVVDSILKPEKCVK